VHRARGPCAPAHLSADPNFRHAHAAADDLERSLDAGVALGLVGEADAAAAMFDRYVSWFESGEEAEWRSDDDEPLYERARTLRDLAPDTSAFRDWIRADVKETRTLLKLNPELELPF
jgi:hypothetical protein